LTEFLLPVFILNFASIVKFTNFVATFKFAPALLTFCFDFLLRSSLHHRSILAHNSEIQVLYRCKRLIKNQNKRHKPAKTLKVATQFVSLHIALYLFDFIRRWAFFFRMAISVFLRPIGA